MKLQKTLVALAVPILFISVAARSHAGKSAAASPDNLAAFLGRWDLTLKAPDREYPSWLELRSDSGQLKAQFVSRWGNARPLPKVELTNGHLTFVSPKEEEDRHDDMVFQGTLAGNTLSGTTTGPDGTAWQWTGKRAPALQATSAPQWGKPIALFDGKDLSSWHPSGPGKRAWTVENGNLLSPGEGPELMTDAKFRDFKLHVEFNCPENGNSGVYLRGRYELQIETDSIKEPPTQRMGGIYGFLAPSPEPARTPGAWQTYDVTLLGRWVTVVQNGQTTIDNKEIPGITGGAVDSHEEQPGPIYLQGSEKGRIAYRSIVITPAKN